MKKRKRGYSNWGLDRNSARDSSPFDVVDVEEPSKEVGVEAADIETLLEYLSRCLCSTDINTRYKYGYVKSLKCRIRRHNLYII